MRRVGLWLCALMLCKQFFVKNEHSSFYLLTNLYKLSGYLYTFVFLPFLPPVYLCYPLSAIYYTPVAIHYTL